MLNHTDSPVTSVESEHSRVKEAASDFVESPGQNYHAPAFDKSEEEVEFVWYSWHPKYPHWSRSCWRGKTEQEARETVKMPMAVGMRNYQNALVRESKRFTVIRPSVGHATDEQSTPPINPNPASPVSSVEQKGEDLGIP